MFGQRIQNFHQLQLTKQRIVVVGLCFAVWAAIITVRLVQYQVFRHKQMVAIAEAQQQRTIKTSPKRGSIVDRNGKELAQSIEVESIYIAPGEIKNSHEMSKPLAKILSLPEQTVLSRLTSTKVLVSLKRKVTEAEASAVKNLNYPGIHFVTETKRFYPKDDLAAYILGFTGLEEEGFSGVERQYERHILGKPGFVFVETDAHGKPFNRYEKEPEIGQSLMLTIDEQIQFRTEKLLREAVENSHSRGGVAVVLQVATGEILAMASTPGFNPNIPVSNPAELREKRRNRAIEDAYEPGSVFKIVPYAAALDAGLLKPEDTIDCQGGAIEIAGHVIRDGGHYGLLTASKAIEVSSNVAAIKTGKRVGKERLLDTISKFGFGMQTAAGLPGEAPGFVGGKKQWSDAAFGALPLGYQVVTTPLQLAAAYAAIANDGEWVQPHILKKVVSTIGNTVFEPNIIKRRVISPKAAIDIRNMLEGVVLRGTAKKAQLEGYTAGGKTGTAKKFDRAARRYSESKYFASFCGFAPVTKPEVVVFVVVDEPPFGTHHGGQAAAPIFKQIAEMTLQYLGVPPDNINPIASDDGLFVAENEQPEGYIFEGTEDHQASGLKSHETTTDKYGFHNNVNHVEILSVSSEVGAVIMPDLRGQGIRTALQRCNSLGLKLEFVGIGEITEQVPSPGTPVNPGSICKVVLQKGK
ncbi:MAG: transpeptidase family protein [Blastocatellia bacterium]|nr:transpeptidase family protein [Blastocatellia bacterium]